MNIFSRRRGLIVLLLIIIFMGSGCSLLQLPLALLNQVLSIVNKLPTPPPGVF